MSKSIVTRLFVGAVVAVTAGLIVAFATVVSALAGGIISFGGPTIVAVDGAAFAGAFPWLLLAALVIAGGALVAMASWIGALVNTYRLEDKTWFAALLVLGLFSFGWIAMVAYVVAGPDGRLDGTAGSKITSAARM